MRQNSRTLRPTAALTRAIAATIEPLELRRMLSTVTYTDIDGDNIADLKITGTSGTDRITVYLDPQHNFSAVHDDKNGNGQINSGELKFGPLPETVDISTLGGTDTVNVRLLSDLSAQVGGGVIWTATAAPVAAGQPIPLGYYAEGVSVYVDLGTGNDKFEFGSPTAPLSTNIANALSNAAQFPIDSDPDGADISEGGDLVLQVDGGNDKDTINFDFSRTSVICSSLIVTSDAGSGDDLVTVTLPDFHGSGDGISDEPSEGIVGCFEYDDTQDPEVSQQVPYGEGFVPSNVSVAIDLGSGKNILTINAHTVIAGSDVHIEVDGGKDTDIINDNEEVFATARFVRIEKSTKLREAELPFPVDSVPGRYVVDIELGSGNDAYYQNLYFENEPMPMVQTDSVFIDFGGEVTYNVRGDSGKDIIRVKDVDNGLDPEENTAVVIGKIEYNLYGGTEDDDVQFDTNPGAQFALIGGGSLKVLVSCDGGNDFGRIDVALVPIEVLGPPGSATLTLSGGSGNDKLGMMVEIVDDLVKQAVAQGPSILLPAGLFGARGYPLLDGGAGSDKYDTEGNVVIVKRGAETFDDSIEPEYVP